MLKQAWSMTRAYKQNSEPHIEISVHWHVRHVPLCRYKYTHKFLKTTAQCICFTKCCNFKAWTPPPLPPHQFKRQVRFYKALKHFKRHLRMEEQDCIHSNVRINSSHFLNLKNSARKGLFSKIHQNLWLLIDTVHFMPVRSWISQN